MSKKNQAALADKIKKIFKQPKKMNRKNLPVFSGGYQSYLTTPGQPVWSGRDYSKFSDEGYIKNVIAYRSIATVASGAASVQWNLHRKDSTGSRSEIRHHIILSLLNHPNPSMAGAEFFESLYSHKLINGNAYIQAIRPFGQKAEELHVLRPDRVAVVAGKGCVPQGYRYTVGDKARDFRVDRMTGQSDVLHLKNFHPLNDWYGLSAIEAAAYSIDQHNEASAWNQALLQNGARPSGALIVKGGENGEGGYLSEEQYLRIKAQLDSTNIGAGNAGRPLLLEGGLDWREMSISPKDMDFINTKNSSARDIALAFGVPPQLLGIPGDNTYNNMSEARLYLWEQTILPMVNNMAGALNNWLVPMFGDERLVLSPNLDDVSALTPRREAAWARISSADFLSDAEKRAVLGV